MSMQPLCFRSLPELRILLDTREISSVELTNAYILRIETTDATLRSFLTRSFESALEQAQNADERIAKGERGWLLGIPFAVKDVICTKDIRTTAGSRILSNFAPPYDATVVKRLRDQGAVLLGKLNCDEFAMGSSTENSAYQVTRNPWDISRTPGGSSGGPAAAVAAGQCVFSLGSDTGGSIRQPASFCGVVGLKPTYGRVSRYGLIAFGSSLDTIGPISRDVVTNSAVLECISGEDSMDSTCVPNRDNSYSQYLKRSVEGLRIGVADQFSEGPIEAPVTTAVNETLKALSKLGARIVPVSLPNTRFGIAAYYICAMAEASSNLARYDGMHFGHRSSIAGSLNEVICHSRSEGFGDEVKRRLMLGTYVLSAGYYEAHYKRAMKVRRLIQRDFEQAFRLADVILTPTSPFPAFRIGEKTSDPIQMYLADAFTVTASLAGLPALSIPAGSHGGLPIGVQLIGEPFAEGQIFSVAKALESVSGCQWPPL